MKAVDQHESADEAAFAKFQQHIAQLALAVPEERLRPLFREYLELRRLIGILDATPVNEEPAHVFSVTRNRAGEQR